MNENIVTNPLSAFPAFAPERVVSLVPSITASLFDLGLGDRLVGITDFCPTTDSIVDLPRLGGPRNPDVDQIRRLSPDLILANREENGQAAVEALAEAGQLVWLSFPLTAQAGVEDLWAMASLFRSDLAMDRTRFLEQALEWAELSAADQPKVRYFCPIWEDRLADGERWWMTFNAQTYSNDVLRLAGGENIFSDRERRYPLMADLGTVPAEPAGERDTRYPRVRLQEILAAQPELVLLPSEPFPYKEEHCAKWMDLLAETPAGQTGRVYWLDGSLITWPGTRLAQALEILPQFFMI